MIRDIVAKKDGKIEIYRFIACIFILIGHYSYYTNSTYPWPFFVSYQFVEFFFILSGYFTARHFDRDQVSENKLLKVLKYDGKKFIRFIPYTLPAIIVLYAQESYNYISVGDISGFWNNLKDIILEMTFLSVFRESGAHLFVMWFLSAMFIVLPLVSLFFLIRSDILKIVFGTLGSVIYYAMSSDYTAQTPLNQLSRAFFGLILGGVIYYICKKIKSDSVHISIKIILTIVFVAAYVIPIYFSYRNYYYSWQYIICFVIWIFLNMSQLTVFKTCRSRIVEFLGQISMPIFIWHIAVIKLINLFIVEDSVLRLLLCIVLTIAISVINMFLVKTISKFKIKK